MPARSHRSLHADQEFRQQLDDAVGRLVKEFDPDKIYLFGSLAKGSARPESSVDLLIIAPHQASVRFLDRLKRAIKVTEDVLPNVTPVVYTPDEVKLLEQQGEEFIQEVLEEGKVLYERKG